ncbi:MAG: LytR C-terminal domain-containing protein [Gemmatimonadota bacterium]
MLALMAFLLSRPHRETIAGHAYPIPSAEDRILVEVLNGTPRQGLARAGARALRGEGIDVVFLGNADSLLDSTQVIARRGNLEAARSVAKILGAAKVRSQTDTLRRVDVTVILGKDFKSPPGLHP